MKICIYPVNADIYIPDVGYFKTYAAPGGYPALSTDIGDPELVQPDLPADRGYLVFIPHSYDYLPQSGD